MSDKVKILDKVAALLAKAEATEFNEERDAFRAKADELMLRYAISEAELAMAGGRESKVKVVSRLMDVAGMDSPYRDVLTDLHFRLVGHSRCRAVYYGLRASARAGVRSMVYGMEADVEYVEMLFNSLRLQLAGELEPKFDSTKSINDNVFAMRNAGLPWSRIEAMCGLAPYGPAQKAYKEACEAKGEEPRRINPKTVKRNFAEGFYLGVSNRLSEMKRAQEAQASTAGSALVLVSNAVDEAFNEAHPNLKSTSSRRQGKADLESMRRGVEAGKRADLGQTRVGGKQKEIG